MFLYITIAVIVVAVGVVCVVVWRKREENRQSRGTVNSAILGGGSGRADGGRSRGGRGGRGGGGESFTANPVFKTRGTTPPLRLSSDSQPSPRPSTAYKLADATSAPLYHEIDYNAVQGAGTLQPSRPTTVFYQEVDYDTASPQRHPTVYAHTVPGDAAGVSTPALGEYGKINTAATYAAPASARAPLGGGPNVYSHLERDASTVALPALGEYATLNTSTTYATPASTMTRATAGSGPNVYSHLDGGSSQASTPRGVRAGRSGPSNVRCAAVVWGLN
jgi:hypothetical protein